MTLGVMDDFKSLDGDLTGRRANTGYLPIEHYGLIGNMRTSALASTDGAIDFMCWPDFDSPSVFCRLLDKDKGGHFSISPQHDQVITTKQRYLPSSNVLQTRFLHEEGVLNLVDFFPRPAALTQSGVKSPLRKWLVRRAECIRGSIDVVVEVVPAFNYARDAHSVEILERIGEEHTAHTTPHPTVLFKSEGLTLKLEATIDCGEEAGECPILAFKQTKLNEAGLGDGITASFTLTEGQGVSFVLREDPQEGERDSDPPTPELLAEIQQETLDFWFNWISQSHYKGRWREVVSRSLLILKLLIYEPTGAIVAAPTFSLPEAIGGVRNWDYRFSWVRDSSFTIYALLRMGFRSEGEAYMRFISSQIQHKRTADGGLPIMFTIRGETEIPEIELSHLSGYRNSQPVRIGNGAAFHTQLDIYGELMDAVYLYNRLGAPVSYDSWVAIREVAEYVCGVWKEPDMSIWEVRGQKQNFVYSKIMLWVALDRAIRLADKRCFPCPQRERWRLIRDEIYEDVMVHGYNQSLNAFIQSYEANEVLDSAVLIAPLVFFIAPNDPRFTNTLEKILRPPEKGGLMSAGLLYRYNWMKSDDGVGGHEGAFSMCTFWLIEALTRAGVYDRKYLDEAINYFENMLSYSNHLSMFSEEIARSGEQLGNTPQAFSHLALISSAFNLDRITGGSGDK